MAIKVFHGDLNEEFLSKEDGGRAIIAYIDNDDEVEDPGMYVKLISWDDDCQHGEFEQFKNKKVKITIETIE